MYRVLAFIVLIIIANLIPWWVFFPLAAAYVYRYEGIEVFILGLGIDAYYGQYAMLPVYSLVTAALLFFFSYARPYISV